MGSVEFETALVLSEKQVDKRLRAIRWFKDMTTRADNQGLELEPLTEEETRRLT